MPPFLALCLWFVLLVALLRFDATRDPDASPALWVPLVWLLIMGSRLPSQWLGLTSTFAVDAFEEGNSFDRTIYFVLIALAVWILLKRRVRWGDTLKSNVWLLLFLSFALLSVTWSAFPFIAFKRWVRDFGSYLMLLVILSDPRPLQAIDTVARRFCYMLIPISIVLIKYYPELGVSYDNWTGAALFQGVATSKNMLGVLCLISGIFFFWDLVRNWSNRKDPLLKRTIRVNLAFIGMTLWLLNVCDSATSRLCLVIGCLVIIVAQSKAFNSRPLLLKGLLPGVLLVYAGLELAGIDLLAATVGVAGRSTTMTGRTELWEDAIRLSTDPFIGAGYGSFWIGDRLQQLWAMYAFRPTQAHNGYIELYLNLGFVGLFLLGGILVASYVRLSVRTTEGTPLASLGFGVLPILFLYNVTEAAFNGHLLWFVFLLATVVVTPQSLERDSSAGNLPGLPRSRRVAFTQPS